MLRRCAALYAALSCAVLSSGDEYSPEDTLMLLPLVTLEKNALEEWLSENDHWPTADNPVTTKHVKARISAALFSRKHYATLPAEVEEHPSAADFPGFVPSDAPRITKTVVIDKSIPRWHSTGSYVPPGELVTVRLPKADGMSAVIGPHTDAISAKPTWRRMPLVSRDFPLSDGDTHIASSFGGLVYIANPESTSGSVAVEIEGVVEAPYYVLGETSNREWRKRIRDAPAPWAEIAGRNMIVTTPSEHVRDLRDPSEVARAWDRKVELAAELAGWRDATVDGSQERFIVDRQIVAGYMHAGYPLMAHLDQGSNLVNKDVLWCTDSTGSWGFYHEVGHNFQNMDWTFDGTMEVTVNLFSLYIYEHLCGVPVKEQPRGSPYFVRQQLKEYDFSNPNFEKWKESFWVALSMYTLLQHAFGWDAYHLVFAEYGDLPEEERPKTDDEKRNQWLVRFSRTVGHNLGPYFEAWGVPTSQEARDSISELPVWMPEELLGESLTSGSGGRL